MWRTKDQFKKQLVMLYSISEINAFWALIMEHLFDYSYTELVFKLNETLSTEAVLKVEAITTRLLRREPIQYILGWAHFTDFKLRVSPFVLIPRVETEELVRQIIDSNPSFQGSIVDIATGSGCIAIAMKRAFQKSNVYAIDVSDKALELASQNAQEQNQQITFQKMDILNFPKDEEMGFDMIISNPPYVRYKERKDMDYRVVNYEPALALYVPDDDPLCFYKAIADFALLYLKDKGRIYFEINEIFGNDIVEMLANNGFSEIKINKDFFGKDRFVECCLNK